MKLNSDRDRMYVHPQSLVVELRRVFAEVEAELRTDATLRDRYFARDRRKSERDVQVAEQGPWRDAVARAEIAADAAYTSTSIPVTLKSTDFLAGATGAPGPTDDAPPAKS